MILEYEFNKQDYIDYNLYHIHNSPTLKKSLFIQRFIVPIIFLVFPLLLQFIGDDIPFWYWSVLFSITFILWIIFFPRIHEKTMIKRVSKLLNEGKNNNIFGKHMLSISDDGIYGKTEASESKWKHVEKVVETENHILVYVSSISAIIVPKRAFSSNEQKGRFLDEVKRFK